MNKNDSMLVIAEQVLRDHEKSLDIHELFAKVALIKEFDDESKSARISQFHTYLTLDGRFVILTDGTWDLREKHSFDVVNSLSTDFDIFDDEFDLLGEDDEDYDALEVTVVTEEEEMIAEANQLKSLVGYDEIEEL